MSDAPGVTDDHEDSRFEIELDGSVAELTYRRRADRLVLIHTGVPEGLAGHGLGGKLVKAAVERAAKEHLTLVRSVHSPETGWNATPTSPGPSPSTGAPLPTTNPSPRRLR
jgi:uncharacterized protein